MTTYQRYPWLERAHEANRQRGIKNAEQYRWIVEPLFVEQGLSYRAIARTLNAYRLKTMEGNDKAQWTHVMISEIVKRLDLKRKVAA